jgi:hypothetical protein
MKRTIIPDNSRMKKIIFFNTDFFNLLDSNTIYTISMCYSEVKDKNNRKELINVLLSSSSPCEYIPLYCFEEYIDTCSDREITELLEMYYKT